MRCYCEGSCPDGLPNGTCLARVGSMCFSAVQTVWNPDIDNYEVERLFGCLPPYERGVMQCMGRLVPHYKPTNILCCNETDLCNKKLLPELSEVTTPAPPPQLIYNDTVPIIALIISLAICAIVACLIVSFVYFRYKRKEETSKHYLMECSKDNTYVTCAPVIHDLIDQSGSGSELALLVQRTIAKQIQMMHSIGKGRYGEVWLGKWRGEKVAVKVFFTSQEASWLRETEVYQTSLCRHDNILGFVAADIQGTVSSGNFMMLITDYHELGSLYDVLKNTVLDLSTLLLMAKTAAAGIAYLHTEVVGTKGKPAIAHRDIKSRNILVKTNRECVIADFGLAVIYNSKTQEVDITPNTRVGTRRYMAPEVLRETINTKKFEAFKEADMYSLSLVFWELARRCISKGNESSWSIHAEDYALPYHDLVPEDPSFDDMHDVVCIKKKRPPVPERWKENPVLNILSRIMTECWRDNPSARLSSLRVKKTLSDIKIETSIKIL